MTLVQFIFIIGSSKVTVVLFIGMLPSLVFRSPEKLHNIFY